MRSLVTWVAAVLVVCGGSTAHAESYVIRGEQGSYLIFDYEGDFFKFTGDGFFVANNGVFGVSIPRVLNTCTICSPGDIVNVSFRTPGDDVEIGGGAGRVIIGGTTYKNVQFRGRMEVQADPFVVPDRDTEFMRPAMPFQFTSFLRGFLGDTEVFSGTLTGAGSAFIPLFRNSQGLFEWEEGRLDYWFRTQDTAPVPEPTSMLLIGSGLAGLIAARKRRSIPQR